MQINTHKAQNIIYILMYKQNWNEIKQQQQHKQQQKQQRQPPSVEQIRR